MPFTDALIKPGRPEESKIFPYATETTKEAQELINALCEKVKTLSADSIDYNIQCRGLSFRGHRQETETGTFHALRVLRKSAMPFNELGIPKSLADVLLSELLCKGGLVLISGAKGSGKSTTLASIVTERLDKFGGLALTIENPIETIIAGDHGEGFCLQTSVTTDIEAHEAIRGAMRCFPSKQVQSILMLGEIRDYVMAGLALQAALDGSLVVATTHGMDIIATLRRLASLASSNLLANEAYSILADAMRVTIHQRYENGIHKFSALMNKGNDSSIVRHIAANNLERLSTDIEIQANQILNGDKIW